MCLSNGECKENKSKTNNKIITAKNKIKVGFLDIYVYIFLKEIYILIYYVLLK